MKIMFLEEAANLGGARIATVDLAASLNKRDGIQAEIYDISGTCKPFIDYCFKKGVDCRIIAPLEKPLILASSSLWHRLINTIHLIKRIFIIRRRLKDIIRQDQPDYIILNSYRRLLYLWGAKKKTEICFYAHGWYIPQQVSRFQKFLLRSVVTKFLCVSEATKQALYSNRILPLNSIYVVHNGIDIEALPKEVAKINNSEGCFKILHSGGFTEGKGQLISVEIARILKKRGFKFKLILTGLIYAQVESKHYYNKVIAKIKQYGLERDIEIILNKNNVIDYFRACDVLIHPSQTEGLPLVLMEAMALRKPVLANSVGGVTDYILNGFTGFLPMHDNPKEYADLIMNLSDDKQLYDYIANNAFELVSNHFTVDTQLTSLMKVFNDNGKES